MDPLTIGILAASAIGKGTAAYAQQRAQANQMFGDSAEERLRELERMEEMRALGLTSQEEQTLQRKMLDPVQAASKEQMIRQQALMGQVDTSGRGLADMMKAQEREDRQIQAASNAVAMADLQRAREMETEMRKLQDREAASDALKKASFATLLGTGLSAAGDAYMQQQAFDAMSGYKGTGTTLSAEDQAMIKFFMEQQTPAQ